MKSLREREKALLNTLSSAKGLHCPYEKSCLLQEMRPDINWCYHLQKHIGGNCQCLTSSTFCRTAKLTEMLAELYLKRGRVNAPPTPMYLIASADPDRKIEIQLLPLKAHHGCLWFFGDEWLIQLNTRDPKEERPSTLFHEAFHILCYNVSPSFKGFGQSEPLRRPFYELLADYFATCVIMPKKWICESFPGIKDTENMSRLFGVSRVLIERRLAEYGLAEKNVE